MNFRDIPFYVITGPTSSGKTGTAIKLAKHINGEIISADSRQVYKGLNLCTGKVTEEEKERVPHHLIDIREPLDHYSIVDFKRDAERLIVEVHSRGKIPILCGGSGQWISALIEQHEFREEEINHEQRAFLESLSLDELQSRIEENDIKNMSESDIKNKRRLIRRLEQKLFTKDNESLQTKENKVLNNVFVVSIHPTREILRESIEQRLEQRLDKGMIEEVGQLLDQGKITHERMLQLGLELKFISKLLSNEISIEEFYTRLKYESWHYAKRQMTWWNKKEYALKVISPEAAFETLITKFVANTQ